MYKKIDAILSENGSVDYFYDEECLYVEELLSECTENDWKKFVHNLKNVNDEYKIKLAYCIEEDSGMNGFYLLLELLKENDEVVEYALDSLRSFNKQPYKNLILSDKTIVEKAESLLKNASPPVKLMLEVFLEQNK